MSDFMHERWRVRTENERTKSADFDTSDLPPQLRDAVDGAPNFRAVSTLVTESGLFVLPKQFDPQCAGVLAHIADLHNATLPSRETSNGT